MLLEEIESIEMCIDDVLICETTEEEHHKRLKSAFGRTMKQDPNYTTNVKLQFSRKCLKEGLKKAARRRQSTPSYSTLQRTKECTKWDGW